MESANVSAFMKNGLKDKLRIDGRRFLESRNLSIEFGRKDVSSFATICMGTTRVLGVVSGEIVAPYPDRPTEGFLTFQVDISAMASEQLEAGRNSVLATDLTRIVERSIRGSKALDTEALVLIGGEKVWSIKCVVHVLDYGGNVIDAVELACIAALLHFRRPDVAVVGNKVVVQDAMEKPYIPLSLHHVPVCISYYFYHEVPEKDPIILFDPSELEESILTGSVTFTFNSYDEMCAVHLIGGTPVSSDVIMQCARLGCANASQRIKMVKELLEKEDKALIDTKRDNVRGLHFKDQVVHDQADAIPEEHLGELTNFDVLHQPIPLKNNTQVVGVSSLLESFERSANASYNKDAQNSNPDAVAISAQNVKDQNANATDMEISNDASHRNIQSVQSDSSDDDSCDDLASALN